MKPPTDEKEPEAVLRLPEIDTDLVQALAKHWLVTVEQNENEILYKIYSM